METLPFRAAHRGKAWEFLNTSILKSLQSRGTRSSFWLATLLRPILQSLHFGTGMRGDVMESRTTPRSILKRGAV